MLYEDFLSDFNVSIENNDLISANNALMKELGNILVRKKQDFVDLLNESGVSASINDSDLDLVNSFVNNVASNKKLMLGASLLTQMHNKQMGFDGEEELSDIGVKNGYQVMRSYFIGENYSNTIDDIIGASTAKGAASGGLAGVIAGAVGDVAKATTKISEGQQKKKYGGQEIAQKREEAKQQMIQAILAQKQQKLDASKKAEEEKAKTKRLIYIVGGSVLGLAVLGLVIYSIKKGKK